MTPHEQAVTVLAEAIAIARGRRTSVSGAHAPARYAWDMTEARDILAALHERGAAVMTEKSLAEIGVDRATAFVRDQQPDPDTQELPDA